MNHSGTPDQLRTTQFSGAASVSREGVRILSTSSGEGRKAGSSPIRATIPTMGRAKRTVRITGRKPSTSTFDGCMPTSSWVSRRAVSTGPASSAWGFPPGKAICPAWLLRFRDRLVRTNRRIPSRSAKMGAKTAAKPSWGAVGASEEI